MPTPPASWELATPVFGIRYPKPTAPAKFLPDAFAHIGGDLESALIADGATPPNLNYVTGTRAARLAATPVTNQIWIETDQPGNPQFIGTGTAWLPLSSSADPTGRMLRAGHYSGIGSADGRHNIAFPTEYLTLNRQIESVILTPSAHGISDTISVISSYVAYETLPVIPSAAKPSFTVRQRRDDTSAWFGGNPGAFFWSMTLKPI